MLPIGPAAPNISPTSNFVPAPVQAAAADRSLAESPVAQITPMYFAPQPQPAGAPTPSPTAEGAEPAEIEPVWCGAGSGWPRPHTFDAGSVAAKLVRGGERLAVSRHV